jgi:excisionase family DNA binding protein
VRALRVLKNWISDGSLPALRAGRRVRIRRKDFLAFVDNGYIGHRRRQAAFDAQAFWDGEEMPLPDLPDPE